MRVWWSMTRIASETLCSTTWGASSECAAATRASASFTSASFFEMILRASMILKVKAILELVGNDVLERQLAADVAED